MSSLDSLVHGTLSSQVQESLLSWIDWLVSWLAS